MLTNQDLRNLQSTVEAAFHAVKAAEVMAAEYKQHPAVAEATRWLYKGRRDILLALSWTEAGSKVVAALRTRPQPRRDRTASRRQRTGIVHADNGRREAALTS